MEVAPRWQGASNERTGTLATLAAGTRVGKYEILTVLGQGGFGISYRARDTQLDRDVAVKEYLPTAFAVREPDSMVLPRSAHLAEDFRWGRDRFLAEAKTLAHLEHAAGVVNVHDFLEANGTAYMVMALARGETLEVRLRRERRLSQAAIERFLPPLLDGLEKVHAADFLHRDIKPANILIDADGQPTLIDFGASRAALQGRTQALTAVYTPGYAAFEQFTSAKQGPWTDIYALGATLYHCVTGVPPPSAADRMRDDTLVPAVEAGKGHYAPYLLVAIDAAVRLRDAERPQTIAAWRQVLSDAAPAMRPQWPARAARSADSAGPGSAWRTGTPKRWLLRLAAALLVLCLGGGGYFSWRGAQEAEELRRLDEARRQEDDAWVRAKAANAIAPLRAYLEHYPSGRYAAEARALITDIESAGQAAAAQRAEDEAWAAAKATSTAASLRLYLELYPSGRYVAEARALTTEIEQRDRKPKPQDCPRCPEMVSVPSGAFMMGAAPGEHVRQEVPAVFAKAELPQHRVTIGYAFSLGKYEVTRGEFEVFVQATGHRAAGDWRNPGFSQSDRDPVVNVSWDDAKAYVTWLSRISGKKYRLPSEAEWEYAARAGTTTARYWGDRHQDACRYANVNDDHHECRDGHPNTAPVGQFQPNPFGLYDMLGNVWEWTEDCWNPGYDGAPADGSPWLRANCGRVIRGGSWNVGRSDVRAANRLMGSPGNQGGRAIGFRVARTD